MSTLGRPLKLSDDDRAILVGLVQANPLATNDELIASLESRTGIKIHRDTLQRHLRAAGVERRQNAVAVEVQRSE
ncbi:MAG: helix-turn-helix domain-containing protein, partial [Pseudomonadales bacterium]|nr:helix-turn-helix domain-containing protein [Pseudomonadales bacterium]